nr:MAG TPA_asm: hypothetical protein [Caudoviricetes sp.]
MLCRSPSSGKPIVHLPPTSLHFAPPLLYAKPVTLNRYQLFYKLLDIFLQALRYIHHRTHTAFRRIVNTLLLLFQAR